MIGNRLAGETSPYLLQHAENPVDWYPWSDEALGRARLEQKPIFLSIGYAACHWCHVMAHESFEDERVAEILNERFVNIKVDREERPDLDRIYMSAVQALTGGGGWPMSVFLTPEGHPFYGGTYFPPQPRYGMPSFTDVLTAVADAWDNRRDELVSGGERLVAAIEQQMSANVVSDNKDCSPEVLNISVSQLADRFDDVNGGWGGAPKFPQPMVLEFLLRYHHETGDDQALRMVEQTLQSMARGGIYDQVGGGFHRYSVDNVWLTPHFEKMLYDNAQLARVYLHAWQVTGDVFYRTIVEETLDYVMREMTDPAGGFYSTQDADSEGEEGKFYVWDSEEVSAILGEVAANFKGPYGVTIQGNFEGKNILTFAGTVEERDALREARRQLYDAREQRVHPARDEKVLTSWNGLMLAAFAEAARVLEREDYSQVAEQNAEFLLRELRTDEGRLFHTWTAGVAKVNGYLEDYAFLLEGLIELYQTTFDPDLFAAARELADVMIAHFRMDGEQLDSEPQRQGRAFAGFYDTSDDHEELIVRPRELQDNAIPSGNGMAVTALLRLAGLAGEPGFSDLARKSLSTAQDLFGRYPLGFGQWLIGLSYLLAHPLEIAIVGDPGVDDVKALLDSVFTGYRPHQVVAVGNEASVPLLRDRVSMDGNATAYVCVDRVCRPPVTDPASLRELVEQLTAEGS